MNSFDFSNLDRETLLSPKFIALWENFNMGIVICDSNGICCYMNKMQIAMDGFTHLNVVGMHISELYLAHEAAQIPTLEVLEKKEPLLKKTYWYKTNNNQLFNSINDFFPLFKNNELDGVISFTSVLSTTHITNTKSQKNKIASLPLYSFEDIIGEHQSIQNIVSCAKIAATCTEPVIIYGESGTGKELFAQAIHSQGSLKDGPFIPINCAAIPENLLEGLLFGTVKGSFTGAVDSVGLFEEANNGTILFDELNSMPLSLQAKLLRVIQEKKIRRVGSKYETPVNVRIISILNEHPLKAIERGVLRQDLYYRLAVIGLSIPPLRERKEDIPLLVNHFIKKAAARTNKKCSGITDEALQLFFSYSWQGNIRELEHVINGVIALLKGELITINDLPEYFIEQTKADVSPVKRDELVFKQEKILPDLFDYSNLHKNFSLSLKSCLNEYEKKCIINVLKFTGGNIAKAAKILEMTPPSLHYRIKILKIEY